MKHMTESFKELQEAREQLHRMAVHHWKSDVVFTWEWWLLAGLTIIPLILWWIFVDRKRVYEIALFGCLLDIMCLILDNIGTDLLWWAYPIKLIPTVPVLFTADSILVPIVFMVVYQLFYTTWWSIMIFNLITAGLLAFIAEPIFTRIGYYHLNEWRYAYSFVFYLLAAATARLIIVRIKKQRLTDHSPRA